MNPDDRISSFVSNIHGTLLLGILTAMALTLLSISGIKIWWRRRNDDRMFALDAPAKPKGKMQSKILTIIIGVFALFSPMIALSLIGIFFIDILFKPLINPKES